VTCEGCGGCGYDETQGELSGFFKASDNLERFQVVRFDGDLNIQYLYNFRIRNDRCGFLGSDDELIRELKRLGTDAEYGLRLQQFRKKVDIVRIEEIEDPKWKCRE